LRNFNEFFTFPDKLLVVVELRRMFGAILTFMLVFQAGAHDFTAAPGESGVWLLQNGAWLTMLSAPHSRANARGLDNYIYTDGYTNLNMDVSFAGPKADLRISGREPVFIARLENDGFEPVLIRLEKKKNRRICRSRPSSASIGNKHGFSKKDIVQTILTVNPDKSITVRPELPLKPGEYLLVTGSPSFGRDFGVD
jgi:hypothetical protein